MCATCGCDSKEEVSVLMPGEVREEGHHHHPHDHHHHHHHGHDHDHDHNHGHGHTHSHDTGSMTIDLEKDVLYKNNLMAERNRGFFEARSISALNLVSSPGSGKTTLLESTIKALKDDVPMYIIEGDQQTMNDANRIAAAGAPVVQVNTGKGCHLDSDMIHRSIEKLDPEQGSVLFIENVGNLVCPSMFDLGETGRVVIMSVTEGEDKPLKYPTMFETSQICVINKIDLLPHLNYDLEKAIECAKKVNPTLEFFQVSATTGEGMDGWIDWVKQKIVHKKTAV